MNATSNVDHVDGSVDNAFRLGSVARYGTFVHLPGFLGFGSSRQTTQASCSINSGWMPAGSTGTIIGRDGGAVVVIAAPFRAAPSDDCRCRGPGTARGAGAAGGGYRG